MHGLIDSFISKRDDVNPQEGEKEYGDVAFADETNKKYPIDTEEHIRAAWNYISKKKNAGKYSPEEVKRIKGKIAAAWKKKIDPKGPEAASENGSTFLIDAFVNVRPGEPYRLFPFGKVVKGGREHEITAEYASKFRLPHFKPPIKLGSHEETTPAGGQLVGLEVRADGLYGIPEYTDRGNLAIAEGDYRYHSPEVIWDEGGLEDPATGEIIPGPLIIGDALLHTPHLGEAAALYSITPIRKEAGMENVSIPASLFERFLAVIGLGEKPAALPAVGTGSAPAPVPAPVTPETPGADKFQAVQAERDQFKSELDQLKAKEARQAKIDALVGQLQKQEDFGSTYISLDNAMKAAEMLAGMSPEQQDWVMRTFKAQAAQIKAGALFAEHGSTGAGADADPGAALDAAVRAEMAKSKSDYAAALEAVKVSSPDVFNAWYTQKGK